MLTHFFGTFWNVLVRFGTFWNVLVRAFARTLD